jgi:Mrp family chromosome partitioning ATPase
MVKKYNKRLIGEKTMAEKSCSNSGCSKESCEGCASNNQPTSFQVEPNIYTNVKKVIGIVSGKGGVGKSMITASLATLMQNKGYTTGILDADITGPSIPKMFGVKGPAQGNEEAIFPEVAENGTKIMSINLLMEDEEAPVIWRGPVIAGMVKQFWSDVMWGELDFLFVDMPPGTGDVPLTVFQSLPVDGIVIVTSPQDLVSMIVKKAYHMAKTMNIPILGIVENYSYIKCPDCEKEIKVFGESHIDEIAQELGLEVLGKVPIDPVYAQAADEGVFYSITNQHIEKASEKLVAGLE